MTERLSTSLFFFLPISKQQTYKQYIIFQILSIGILHRSTFFKSLKPHVLKMCFKSLKPHLLNIYTSYLILTIWLYHSFLLSIFTLKNCDYIYIVTVHSHSTYAIIFSFFGIFNFHLLFLEFIFDWDVFVCYCCLFIYFIWFACLPSVHSSLINQTNIVEELSFNGK